MPDRRMIHRKAAHSSDLADLREAHGSDAVSFFLLTIPFYDRYGCVPDDPRALRGMVCPLWDDVSTADVKRWVGWLVKRGMLVKVTGPGGAKGLRNPHFEEHQAGAKLEREAPSVYEPAKTPQALKRPPRKPPNSRGVRTKSGPSPDPVRTSKGQRSKEGRVSPVGKPPSPLPPTQDRAASAAATPPPSPGAKAAPPGVNGNGQGHDAEERVDLDAIEQAIENPDLRAAVRRGRRKAGAR